MILTIVFTYPTQNKILYGDLYNIKQSYYNKDISFVNYSNGMTWEKETKKPFYTAFFIDVNTILN